MRKIIWLLVNNIQVTISVTLQYFFRDQRKSQATSTLLDENLTCEFKRKIHSLSPSHVWKLSSFFIACEKQSYSHLNSRTWPESKRKLPCGFDAAFFKTVFRAVKNRLCAVFNWVYLREETLQLTSRSCLTKMPRNEAKIYGNGFS